MVEKFKWHPNESVGLRRTFPTAASLGDFKDALLYCCKHRTHPSWLKGKINVKDIIGSSQDNQLRSYQKPSYSTRLTIDSGTATYSHQYDPQGRDSNAPLSSPSNTGKKELLNGLWGLMHISFGKGEHGGIQHMRTLTSCSNVIISFLIHHQGGRDHLARKTEEGVLVTPPFSSRRESCPEVNEGMIPKWGLIRYQERLKRSLGLYTLWFLKQILVHLFSESNRGPGPKNNQRSTLYPPYLFSNCLINSLENWTSKREPMKASLWYLSWHEFLKQSYYSIQGGKWGMRKRRRERKQAGRCSQLTSSGYPVHYPWDHHVSKFLEAWSAVLG